MIVTPRSRTRSIRRPGVAPGGGVQPRRQLVEHRDLRVADERQRDREPLALAAGELGERAVLQPVEPQRGRQLARVGRRAVEGREQVERLADAQPVGQLGLLELRAEELAQRGGVRRGVVPEDADGPAVALPEPLDALDGGGLAGAVGAEDPEDLALLDGERHVLDGHVLSVALVQVVDLDDAHGWSVLPAPRPHIAQPVRPDHPPDG